MKVKVPKGSKNVFKIQGIPKLVELFIIFILMMLTRFGGAGATAIQLGSDYDLTVFTYMVIYGYFLIVLVQVIGLILNEEYNFQNLLFTALGSLFFLAVGGAQLSSTLSHDPTVTPLINRSNRLAHGSMCLITSVVFAADAVIQVVKYRQEYM